MFGDGHGFLEDSKGNASIMRLAFLILILNAVLMGWYSLMFHSPGESIAVFSALSGVAVTLKTIQNQQEKQEPVKK